MRRFFQATVVAALVAGCGGTTEYSTSNLQTATRAGPVSYPKFGDHDPHDWDVSGPHSYPVHGIDVSRYQGPIDWAEAGRSGVSFAYIKATEGGEDIDPMFRDHWQGAKRAGVAHGAYHFYYFCKPAEVQARWFIANVPKDSNALPPVLDMEWNPFSPTCRLRPPAATVRAEAKRFLDILEAHYGQRPVIYTTVDFYHETGIGDLPRTQFWLRSVAGHPRDVFPGQSWTFWQYTGTGMVPGVRGPVDINVFRGQPAAWRSWRS